MVTPEEFKFARNYINDNCIARVEPGSKALPSYLNQGSGYYTWQFYLREALFNPLILDIIVRDFLDKFEPMLKTGDFQICGVESASTPIMTGILIATRNRGYGVNAFSIRKEQKPYGKKNWLEGKVLENKFTIMVDDLTSSSHKTAIHAASVLFNHAIPLPDNMYAAVFKTDTPEINKIKLLGKEVTLKHMFVSKDFDLQLATYLKNKEPRS